MSERDVALYIDDMIEFAGLAVDYAKGLTEATLMAERMRYDAILRNIQLIGEAATHVPEAVRLQAPDIPWRKIVGARNRIVHGYLGISVETVWNVLDQQLPVLLAALRQLLHQMQRPQG